MISCGKKLPQSFSFSFAVNRGLLYALLAYLAWGIFPIYWKQLSDVDAYQVIAHRIFWAFIFLFGVVRVRQWFQKSPATPISAGVFRWYALAGFFIGINWFVYVWAVHEGRILEASLGYFLNPLLNVALGAFVFRERFIWHQALALVLAASGVLVLSRGTGSFPWVSVILAVSFAAYGLVKKKASLDPIRGLQLETGYWALPALVYLLWRAHEGSGSFLHSNSSTDLLLIGGGLVTTLPLVLFAAAAPRIPFSTLGVLQFVSPSLQFACGVLLYHEPFGSARLLGFGLVWLGVLVFFGGLKRRVRNFF
jgi:chloramphenicol-sensitive protein RarD